MVLCQPPPHITPDIPRSRKLIGLLKENFRREVLKEKENDFMWGRLKAGFAGWVRVAPACVASVKREAKLMSRARFQKTETYSCQRIDRTRLLLMGDRKLESPMYSGRVADQ